MKKIINIKIFTSMFFLLFLLLFVGCFGITPINHAPTITSAPITTATVDVLYTYDLNATDTDVGDTLTYSLTTKSSGMTIDSSTGVISWTPTFDQIGDNNVTVEVSDGSLSDNQNFIVTVDESPEYAPDVNHSPVITSTPVTSATKDEPYSYNVDATDSDGDILTYSLTTKPSGMSVNSSSGMISWTPTATGSFGVTVEVSDGELFDTQSFTVIVEESGTSTRIISLSGDTTFGDVHVSESKTQTLTISNTGNSSLAVTSISYPAGFSGSWSGTISAGGSRNVTVTFAPTQAITYSGTLTVSSNKTGGINTKTISGTGIPITTTIIVTSPNGGETWNVGGTRNITWTVSGDISHIDHFILGYGTNGICNQYYLGTTSSASRSYSWIIPNTPSTQCKIGVWAIDVNDNSLALDDSDGLFTISPVIDTRIISLSGDTTFGDVHVSESKTQTLTISNTGNSSLAVTSISYPAGFSGSWSGTISAGGSRNVTVTFAPTEVKTYSGTLTVSSNKTGGINTKTISGTGIPITTTIIVTSPNGGETWNVGGTRNITWTVSGDISHIDHFILGYGTNGICNQYYLGTTSSASRSYSWIIPNTPSTQCKIGVWAIDVNDNSLALDDSDGLFTISPVIDTRIISLSGDTTFGDVHVSESKTQTLTISNTGNSSLAVTSISYPAGFSGSWSGTISAGGSRNVTVTFAPTEVKTYSGTLTVSSNKTGGINTKTISGNGVLESTRIISLSGDLDFDTVQVGSISTKTLRISNTGNSSLLVTGITYPAGFSGPWNGTIPAGGYHDVTVTFTPTQVKIYDGILTVSSNKTGGTNTKEISGTVGTIPPAPIASDGTYTDKIYITWNSVTGASYYKLYRATSATGTKTAITSWQTSTTYYDYSVTPGTIYYYFVKAATSSSGANVSPYSNYDPGYAALSAPTGVSATDGTYTDKVKITWNSVTGATHYQVYRATSATGTKTAITSWQSSTYYYDTNVIQDKTYYYWVKAIISTGYTNASAYSSYDPGYAGGVLPDLVISSLTHSPASPTTVDPITFTAVVKNIGTGSAGASTLSFRIGGESVSPTFSVPALAPGETHTVQRQLVLGIARNYGTIAIADVNNDVTESDETNNQRHDTFTVYPAPDTRIISLSGDTIFGDVYIGDTDTTTLRISNTGNSTLTVYSITYPSGFSGDWHGDISAGSYHNVTVTFSPTQEKYYYGDLTVDSNKTSGINTKFIAGAGISDPDTRIISLSGDGTFGNVYVGDSRTQTMTISNTGNATLAVYGISYPAGFSGPNWSGDILPGDTQDISVIFAPTQEKYYSGTLTVSSNKTSGTNTRSVSGTGEGCTNPPVNGTFVLAWTYPSSTEIVSLVHLDWSDYTGAEGYRIYRSTNGGDFSLLFEETESKSIDYSVTPGNTYSYYVTAFGSDWETCPSDQGTTTVLPSCALISPTHNATVTDPTPSFTWNPVGVTSFPYGVLASAESQLTVYDQTVSSTSWKIFFSNLTTSSATYDQDGQATPLVDGHSYEWGSTVRGLDSTGYPLAISSSEDWNFVYDDEEADTRIISLSGDMAFGSVNVSGDTATRTLTISNTGNSSLNVTGISYPYSVFSGNFVGSIAAGSSQPVDVTFDPSAVQTYSGTLTVNSNKTGGTNTKLISGTGVEEDNPIISLSGDMNFGEVYVDTTNSRTLTISNTGDSTLHVSSINHSNTAFSNSWAGNIPAGESHDVPIFFTPTEEKYYSGTITVNSNATGGINTKSISGTGIIPTRIISLSGDTYFGDVYVGNTATRTLTISNTGNSRLVVDSISYSTTGFSGDWYGNILAGDSQDVTVTFAPTQVKYYSGTLTVNSNKTSGTNTKSISGTGKKIDPPTTRMNESNFEITATSIKVQGEIISTGGQNAFSYAFFRSKDDIICNCNWYLITEYTCCVMYYLLGSWDVGTYEYTWENLKPEKWYWLTFRATNDGGRSSDFNDIYEWKQVRTKGDSSFTFMTKHLLIPYPGAPYIGDLSYILYDDSSPWKKIADSGDSRANEYTFSGLDSGTYNVEAYKYKQWTTGYLGNNTDMDVSVGQHQTESVILTP